MKRWKCCLCLVALAIAPGCTSVRIVSPEDARWIIGVASLSIPMLCFPLLGLRN